MQELQEIVRGRRCSELSLAASKCFCFFISLSHLITIIIILIIIFIIISGQRPRGKFLGSFKSGGPERHRKGVNANHSSVETYLTPFCQLEKDPLLETLPAHFLENSHHPREHPGATALPGHVPAGLVQCTALATVQRPASPFKERTTGLGDG